jgi:GNAT superfamily N-acetyltransferase
MTGSATPLSSSAVSVETRDEFSCHGEEVLIARYWPGIADRGFTWPATGVTIENYRNREGIVARVDGAIAGRAVLEAVFYPLAELVNLEVAPAYRGRGVGNAIVRHAMEAAARAGFLAIHVQTFLNETGPHRLYARAGFVSATRGEMLRLWRFINLPALAQFLYDHPLALFDSRPGEAAREHVLRWHEPAGADEIAVTLRGGSCQFDSKGVRPAVSGLRLRSGPVCLAATVEAEGISIGERCDVRLRLANEGSAELTGGSRIGLNPGFAIAGEHAGGERFSLSSGASLERTLTIEVTAAFQRDLLRIASYWSVPVTVEFLLKDHTFWLTAEVPFEKPT